jgi:hypothetical protein
MQQDGQLRCDCDHCAFLPAFASMLSQLHAPSAQVAVDSPRTKYVVGSLRQERS